MILNPPRSAVYLLVGEMQRFIQRADTLVDLLLRNDQGRRYDEVAEPRLHSHSPPEHLRADRVHEKGLAGNLVLPG